MSSISILQKQYYENGSPSTWLKNYNGASYSFGMIGRRQSGSVLHNCVVRLKFSIDTPVSAITLTLNTTGANSSSFTVGCYVSASAEEYINYCGTSGSLTQFTVNSTHDYTVTIPIELYPGTYYLFLVPGSSAGYYADVFANQNSLSATFISVPSIISETAFRCDSSGTADENGMYILARAGVVWSGTAGSCTLKCRFKATGGAESGWYTMTPGQATILGGALSPDTSYTVTIQLEYANGGVTKTKIAAVTIPTRLWAFHLREGGRGAAFGKTAETDYELQLPAGWKIRIGNTALGEAQLAALLALIQ